MSTIGLLGLSGAASAQTTDLVKVAEVSPLPENIAEVVDVAPVWSGHPVGFALLTRGDQQFAAFYDAERHLTIGQRQLGEKSFRLTRLPSQTGWDSHNSIVLDADDEGFLHLSGNMHGVPLIYFRGTRPLDASSLERVPNMTGVLENRVTYPLFFRGPNREFLFTYRDGSSGSGNQIYNRYDAKSRTWRRLLDQPLFDGQGQRNAYPSLPTPGPDGFYHIVWVWRETGDAATNHDPSYARSRDLVNWENSRGEPLKLPITLQTGDIVDPVPEKGGVINNNVKLGFDGLKRVIVSYHKYDAAGNTQIYNARLENGAWKITQTSDWDTRWNFGGFGTLIFDVRLGGVRHEANGTLTQTYSSKNHGSGTWILDPQTLKPTGLKAPAPAYPPTIAGVESKWPEMAVRWSEGVGSSGESGTRYVLRWETLPSNRDRPRPGPLPPPSQLRLYKLQRANVP
ncbi:MAG: BNR repeat-containing protein [Armatimonadetes bacterium]|nr:BNR repeat-containing protein [Armatimonadota bacterium]